jgi:hypothetical protein
MRCACLVVLWVGAGCVDAADVGSEARPLVAVHWVIERIGVLAEGNHLTKTGTENTWDAGAVSLEALPRDGFVEFTTDENTTAKMVGLSNGNTDESYGDIDFAVYLRGDGRFFVYEAGVLRARGGLYAAGDRFRVQVRAGVVTYWKDGAVFYTSAAAPAFPLLVDTSLRTPGATIADVNLESVTFWQNAVGAVATGRDLEKTAARTAWDSGASSIASLTGDGFAEFTTLEATTAKMAGLSSGDDGTSYQDIDFAVYLRDDGGVAVREGGETRGRFGTYQPGDVFRVQVSGGVVSYAQNGAVFYTSVTAPTFPLLLDTSLRTPGATIADARLSPTVPVFENTDNLFVWKRSCDCIDSIAGNSLDLTLPADQQTGTPTTTGISWFARDPAIGNITSGGYWFLSWRNPDGSEAPAFAVAPGFWLLGSDPYDTWDDIFVHPPLPKNVGDTIGPADVWRSGAAPTNYSIWGVMTAHFQDMSGETAPSQVWFTSGIVGVRFRAADGYHYGFVELTWIPSPNPYSKWGRYVPTRWGYHTTPDTSLVVPPP